MGRPGGTARVWETPVAGAGAVEQQQQGVGGAETEGVDRIWLMESS